MKVVLVLAAFVAVANAKRFESRIVGGKPAKEGQFPYQVYLKSLKKSFFCGGSILNERWILTAAHCLEGIKASTISVVAGTNFLSEGGKTYKVESAIPHGRYGCKHDTRYDIELLKVTNDIQFNNKVQPIPINREEIGIGEELVVSGWGSRSYPGNASNELQFTKLLSICSRQCSAILAQVQHLVEIKYVIDETQICTYSRIGQGACKGDSGGPVVYKGKVAGIVSWSLPCAVGLPDVFTRVSAYADWIEANMD